MTTCELTAETTYTQTRADFDSVETSLGEMAAYVSDIADALSHDPETLNHALTGAWPDVAALLLLRAQWVQSRDALLVAWHALDPGARVRNPLPPFGAVDPSRALV
jgi:hypothetical protein